MFAIQDILGTAAPALHNVQVVRPAKHKPLSHQPRMVLQVLKHAPAVVLGRFLALQTASGIPRTIPAYQGTLQDIKLCLGPVVHIPKHQHVPPHIVLLRALVAVTCRDKTLPAQDQYPVRQPLCPAPTTIAPFIPMRFLVLRQLNRVMDAMYVIANITFIMFIVLMTLPSVTNSILDDGSHI